MIRAAAVLIALLTTVAASAQWPLFDPNEFLDPRETDGRPVFISRIVIGGASNMSGDGFRPLGENVGYVHLANSFYWRSFEFDYKRSQLQAEDGESAVWELTSRRNDILLSPVIPSLPIERGVVELPNGVLARQTRKATPKSKDTFNAAWYWPVSAGRGIPVMLRSRVTYTTQTIDTDLVSDEENDEEDPLVTRVQGRERTIAIDTDTWFRIAGRDVFGSLSFSETKTTTNIGEHLTLGDHTLGERKERALTYTNRFPSIPINRAKILIRPTLAVGGISNRGGSAVNLVNPAIEIFRPFLGSGANLHVIYSPQWTDDGEKWRTTHQVGVFIDRALFVKVF
jgi:hypothetical protein